MNKYLENSKAGCASVRCFIEIKNFICGVTWLRDARNYSQGREGPQRPTSLSHCLISYKKSAVKLS